MAKLQKSNILAKHMWLFPHLTRLAVSENSQNKIRIFYVWGKLCIIVSPRTWMPFPSSQRILGSMGRAQTIQRLGPATAAMPTKLTVSTWNQQFLVDNDDIRKSKSLLGPKTLWDLCSLFLPFSVRILWAIVNPLPWYNLLYWKFVFNSCSESISIVKSQIHMTIKSIFRRNHQWLLWPL